MYSGCSYLKIRQYDSMTTMSTHVCDVCVCVSVCIHIYATRLLHLSVVYYICIYVCVCIHTQPYMCNKYMYA